MSGRLGFKHCEFLRCRCDGHANQVRLNLSRQTGNDPPLVGLLRVFKDYYPEIIVGEAVRGKASAFKVRLV